MIFKGITPKEIAEAFLYARKGEAGIANCNVCAGSIRRLVVMVRTLGRLIGDGIRIGFSPGDDLWDVVMPGMNGPELWKKAISRR